MVTFVFSDFDAVGLFALKAGGRILDEGDSSVLEPIFETGLTFVRALVGPGVRAGLNFEAGFLVSFFGNAGGGGSSLSFDVVLVGGEGAEGLA